VDFEYSDEQRLLRESVARFVADRYDFEARLEAMRRPGGWNRDVWRGMAELGLLGLPFAEQDGGFGGGGVETMIVMEELGRGLVLEPFLSTVILAGGAIRHAGNAEQRQARIPQIAAGELVMALAHQEPGGLRHGGEVESSARHQDGGWALKGRKTAVLHGNTAQEFVVSARTKAGLSLFLVPAATPGLRVVAGQGYDGIPVADVIFDAVEVAAESLLGEDGSGAAVLGHVFEEANAALAAEAVGIMSDTLDLTVEYLKTRHQFGVPIGSFQALQHRCVDMLIEVEQSRSMAILAALSLSQCPAQRRLNIAAAKVQIGRGGRFIGQQAVQLHGAIGITAEYKVGHAFKRLTAIDALFGDADHHLDALADAGGIAVAL
jgi:alkylation response protein AidB-like acyl-CoA dehydrogenase